MTETQEIKAKLRYLRIAPRKVRQVVDVIRGKNVEVALKQLDFVVKRSRDPIKKLLLSAVANAKHNFKMADTGNLYIKEIRVDQGPMLKRFMPRAFGRAAAIRKKTSHVSIMLMSGEGIKKVKPVKKTKIK